MEQQQQNTNTLFYRIESETANDAESIINQSVWMENRFEDNHSVERKKAFDSQTIQTTLTHENEQIKNHEV